ncbi:helix-turn-helix domain-containing protein [Haladaptatus pallidirubidus]|uniref:HTH DNA binding domain-containing protein n=1 Tax=Haladaptatus pallidirubidus TaxID=1008152 RepID=A0AAV3UQW6_9EURY|nr:helix-turn-helix domain-containing protein [Haladaptatus pallidirubidus]
MPTIIEFTVPADEFPLGQIFQDFPDVEIELERMIPTNHALIPYFWVWGPKITNIAAHFKDNPAVQSVDFVDEVEGGGLFRTKWNTDVEGILKGIAEIDIVLLSATGSETKWQFELRTVDSTGITQFQRYCKDNNIDITITRLYALSEMRTGEQYHITTDQEEALIAAFEAGYFNEPREVTLKDIAQEMEITRQSLAARLRRGYRNLIANTLLHETE